LISPGAPSVVTVSGVGRPRLTSERKCSSRLSWLSLLPRLMCSSTFEPSRRIAQLTSTACVQQACCFSDSKTASANRYTTSKPDRSRLVNASYCSHRTSVTWLTEDLLSRIVCPSSLDSFNRSSMSRVDRPRAYISATSLSSDTDLRPKPCQIAER
jgi:hypothetical protein